MKSYSNNRPQGRGGSSQGSMRGKSISTRLSAPAPVNLPSRRQELAGTEAHGSQSSSWGSPSAATAALGASSANSTPGDSPVVPATGTMATTQTGTTSTNGVAGGESPHLDTSPIGSPFHRPIARAWGAVTQPSDQRTEEYPTAAEAAKKIHDHHEPPLMNGGHNATNGKKANASTNNTSGEAMAKTVSALSTDNNWDEVDDEGVDFLNAGEIQFADGSVVVTSTVASSDTQGPGKDTKMAPEHREERVVDRGDVDFNRGPSRSNNSGPSSSLYSHQPIEQPRYPPHDKAYPQLWQGGPPSSHREIDRRPSADRGYIPSQRRDSAGHGPNRRDSHGSKDPFSGPRRDSAQHYNYYDRRDSFEHQHRPRDRDRDRNFPKENLRDRDNRDGDFNPDRRPSYDRSHDRPHDRPHERPQERPQDRFSERRDFQVLSRPRDHLDRHGPHDPSPHPSGHPSGHPFAHPTHSGPPPTNTHDSLQRDIEHVPGQSNPTLDDHTGDQKEAMRHAAEEARKRRENEEREFQESQARARAKADALAKQAEEIKAKAKEREEEEAKAKAKAEEDRHIKTSLTKSEVDAAMADWQALPEKLVKESEERETRSREEWRRKEEESKKAALSTNLTAAPPATVGVWKRSGISVTGKGANEKNSVAKEEKSSLTGISNGASSGAHEVRVDQVDMIMHRIEDSLQARGTSVQEVGASMKRPSETHPIANGTTPDSSSSDAAKHQEPEEKTSKDRVRNAKVARGNASVDSLTSVSSWRKEESKTLHIFTSTQEEDMKAPDEMVASTYSNSTEEQPNKVKEKEHTTSHDAPIVNGIHTKAPAPAAKIKKDTPKPVAVPRPVAAPILSPDSYPAKMTSHSDVAPKISDIYRIHARLAHQAAGDIHANQEIGEIGYRARPVSKHPTKRNSLSNSTASTIFPSNVEKAALKRGSMSFMVDSEIDIPLKDDKPAEAALPMQKQWGDRTILPQAPSSSKIEQSTNDSAKKAWDSTLVEADIATIFTPGTQNVNFRGVAGFPQGSASQVPMGMVPNMYLLNAQVPGMVNPMAQQIWAQSVESSQGLMAPGVVVPGGAPFPVAMSYFRGLPNGVPPPGYMLMVPQGMPPPMAQYVPSRLSVDGSVSPAQGRSLTGSPDIPDSMHDSSENSFIPQASDESGDVEPMPMPWLPRFSVAGDAPQPQAPFILPQPQASIMAAANINRVPQSRPYGVHLQPQHPSRNSGSPESSVPSPNGFPDSPSSPPTDGWTSPSSRHQGHAINDISLPSPILQPQTSQAPAMNSQTSSWMPGGRANGSFGYQGASFHQPHHPGSHGNHRGRGGFNANYHHYRDFRPSGRGGFGHHQPHHYVGPQHYPNGPSSTSNSGSHGPERHGRASSENHGFNSFSRMSHPPSTGTSPASTAPTSTF